MPGDARLLVGIVGEDALHASLAIWLVRRAVAERAEHLGADWALDEDPVRFRAAEGTGDWSKRSGARTRLKVQLSAATGRPAFLDEAAELRGNPRAAEYAAVVRLAELGDEPPKVVLLFEDTDGDDLAPAMYAARTWFAGGGVGSIRALVICAPHQEVEAWIIAGLADDSRVAARRKAVTEVLKVDPCLKPHILPSAVRNSERDPKRVLGCLLADAGEPVQFRSDPPHPSTHDELLRRAFSMFGRLRESEVGKWTGLHAAWTAIRDEIAVLAVPGPP